MRGLITFVLVLAAAVAFTLFSHEDTGFIMMGRGRWTVETSLSVFFLLLILLGFVFVLLYKVWRFGWRFGHRRRAQYQQKAQQCLIQGTLALIQGHWFQAEHSFLKTISQGQLAVLHYLGAAYAAAQQQAPVRMADSLYKALDLFPQEDIALTLFEAQLLLQQHQLLAALQKTLEVRRLAPKNEETLLLLLNLYLQLADWPTLLEYLSELRKRKTLSHEHIQSLENRTTKALIDQTLRTQPEQIAQLWSKIPKATRLRPEVVKVYIEYLMTTDQSATVEALLKESLKYHWDADLLTLYGQLETSSPSQQLNYAESWLKVHDKDVVLFQTLGRLCLRNRLWDKAQQYLENSLSLVPQPLTYQMLGDLWGQRGEKVKAGECYQRGLALALKETPSHEMTV